MKPKLHYLYLILLLGLALRVFFAFGSHYISPDGTQYARLGYHLFHEFNYVSGGSQFPDIIQPPLYPFASGFFTLFFAPEYAGKIASLIFGLLLIWAVFRFTLRLTNKRSLALLAALFVALNPAMVAVSSQVATEALFLLLLFLLYVFLLLYLRLKNFKFIIWAAIVTGLSYLTRPEALLYFAVVVLLLILWRSSLRHIFSYLGIVLIFVGAYSYFCSLELGYLTLSPKLNFIQAQGTVARYFARLDEEKGIKTPPKIQQQRFRYTLSADKKEIAATAIFLKKSNMSAFFKQSQKIFFKTKLKMAARHLSQNSILALRKFLNGLAFPWVYWLFLLFGLWKFSFKKWRREILSSVIFLLPIGAVIFSNVEQRFFYIIPIVLAPLLARGLLQLPKVFFQNREHPIGWIVIYLVLFLGMFPGYSENGQEMQNKSYYFNAGQWLKAEINSNKKVAAVVPQAVFFADCAYCILPFAPPDSVELYLRQKQVDYILIEDRDRKVRPDFLHLDSLPKFLERKDETKIKNHHFILLRIIKEKVHERQNGKH